MDSTTDNITTNNNIEHDHDTSVYGATEGSMLCMTPKAASTPKKVRSLVCVTCGKVYGSRASLRSHVHVEHKQGLACNQCDKFFASKTMHKSHVLSHLGEKRFTCASCGAAYIHKKDLDGHERAKHGGQRHKCDECPNDFRYLQSLVKHKAVHMGRVFKCAEHNKEYKSSWSLKRHMDTIHQ